MAGFSTICLTHVPALTASVSVPRIAAIVYPLGRTLGQPGDSAGQMAVLEATLRALEIIQSPGEVVHLPLENAGVVIIVGMSACRTRHGTSPSSTRSTLTSPTVASGT
jgi:hypothetical protein